MTKQRELPLRQKQLIEALDPYIDDPVGFAFDVVKMTPTKQQQEFMRAVAENRRTSVRSGHGIGKTRAEAVLAWWFLLTRPFAVIPATAPSSHQLYDILWKELQVVYRLLPQAFSDMFDYSSTRIWCRGFKASWYLQARTARPDNPDSIQGFHGEHLLVLIEEASGVHEKVFETLEGALTEEDNRMLLVGNPTRTSGYFYDTHHTHKNEWATFKFSSLDSPLYTKEQAASLRSRYGTHSNVYRIRVLGEFPLAEPDQLIPTSALEMCVNKDVEGAGTRVWGLDVARYGDDESVLAKRHGRKVAPLIGWRNYSTTDLARAVIREYKKAGDERPERIVIDANGIGAGVFDYMYDRGYPVVEFLAQYKSSDPTRWANLKAEVYDEFADDVKSGRISLPSEKADGEKDNDLIAQGSSVKYKINETTGVMQIVGKQELKKQGVASPDRLEAIIMTYFDGGDDEFSDRVEGEAQVQQPTNLYEYDEFKDWG